MSELAFGTAQPLALLRCSGKRKTAGGATRRLVSGLDGENGYRHEKTASLQALLQQTGVLEVSGKGKKERMQDLEMTLWMRCAQAEMEAQSEQVGEIGGKFGRPKAEEKRKTVGKKREKRDPGEERKEMRNKLKRRRGCGLSCPVLSRCLLCLREPGNTNAYQVDKQRPQKQEQRIGGVKLKTYYLLLFLGVFFCCPGWVRRGSSRVGGQVSTLDPVYNGLSA